MSKRILIFFLFIVPWVSPSPLRGEAIPVDRLAVILIVDNSGSMKTNDPERLRFVGAQLFSALLDGEDSLGIIVFSTQAQAITKGLVNPVEYSAQPLDPLMNQKPDGYTDVKAALEAAGSMVAAAEGRYQKIEIVLLTDGKPEIPEPYPEYEQEIIVLADSLGTPITAIGLTPAARTPFLEKLAATTHGRVMSVENASELMDAYMQVLGQIKDRTVLQEKGRGRLTVELDEAVSPYIRSATFVVAAVNAAESVLTPPSNRDVEWDRVISRDFSLITLENPVGGVYRFRGQAAETFTVWTILRSRLRAEVLSPGAVFPLEREMPIILSLQEETLSGQFTKIIGEVHFSATITEPDGRQVSLDRFYDDGTHGDVTPDDGNYTRILPVPEQPGNYRIAVQGSKGGIPFSTEAVVKVLAFPEIEVDAPMGDVQTSGGEIELKMHIRNGEDASIPTVLARVVFPSGVEQELKMEGDQVYSTRFLPIEDGPYKVIFETRGADFYGVDFQSRVEHSFVVSDLPFANVSTTQVSVPETCLRNSTHVLVLLHVHASVEGLLDLTSPDGWNVEPGRIPIRKGEQDITLQLIAPPDVKPGQVEIPILISGENGLGIGPEDQLLIQLEFPGIMQRCRAPIRWGGGLVLSTFLLGLVVRQVRRSTMPALVTGTLRHRGSGQNEQPFEIDLTAIRKNTLLIGSSMNNDTSIAIPGLDSGHAWLRAEKTPQGVEVILEPVGEVRKGYGRQLAPFPLKHGETFSMGPHEFQYLSDSGE